MNTAKRWNTDGAGAEWPSGGFGASGGCGGAGVWRNDLPGWIGGDPAWGRLRQGCRATLQAIADRADRPDEHGDLLNAWGGKSLIGSCGVSRSTFWRHVRRLETLGYLVCVARGLRTARGDLGNVWAIPGSPGALEARRQSRRMQRMVHAGGGRYVPQTLEPHQDAELFPPHPPEVAAPEVEDRSETTAAPKATQAQAAKPPEEAAPRGAEAEPTPPGDVENLSEEWVSETEVDTAPRVRMTRPPVSKRHGPPCQNDTPPSPPHPPDQPPDQGEAPARGVGGKAADTPGGLDPEDRAEIGRLTRWLARIGWRSGTRPGRRGRLISRDPDHALACAAEYRRRAAEGGVRDPAALWDAVFTGRLSGGRGGGRGGGDRPAARPPSSPGVLAQLRRLRSEGTP